MEIHAVYLCFAVEINWTVSSISYYIKMNHISGELGDALH